MTQTFQKSTVREYFESIVIAVILALFVRTWVVQAFKIPTGSMENNLLIGDHLLVNKFVFAPDGQRRSSARCCRCATSAAATSSCSSIPTSRSAISSSASSACPARRSSCAHKKVYINGKPLDEPYVHFLQPASRGAGGDVGRRARALRSGHRAARTSTS